MKLTAGKNNEYEVIGTSQDESFVTTSLSPLLTRITLMRVGTEECVGMIYFADKKDEEQLKQEVEHIANNVYKYDESLCQS